MEENVEEVVKEAAEEPTEKAAGEAAEEIITEAEETVEKASEEPQKKSKKVGILIACCSVFAVVIVLMATALFLLYRGGAFDQSVYFEHTYINEMDCSGLTPAEAAALVTVQKDDYTFTIQERGGSETITGDEIGLIQEPEVQDLEKILADQHSQTIRLLRQVFTPDQETVTLTETYDEDLAQVAVDRLTCLDTASMVAPVDAAIVRNEDNTFTLIPSVAGTTLDPMAARTAIYQSLSQLEESVDLEALSLYTNPVITEEDEDLNREWAQIQTFASAAITYDFTYTTITCDEDDIMTFLEQDEEGNWTLNEDLVHDWVEIQLADVTDTYKKSRQFTTHSGSTITLSGGDYGWRINRDETTAALVEAIEEGAVETIEPVYSYTAKSREENDLGGTYVEISISAQKLWLYKDGECVLSTDIVTGNVAKGYDTPAGGVWKIKYKQSPAVLGTYAVQGYETPVTYWMPFNGGVGLHDADSWRSSYGGSIYKTNGSHGCVNMPTSAAKTVYNTISAGTAVVVY